MRWSSQRARAKLPQTLVSSSRVVKQSRAIAGIEFITDAAGELYTYDVNTNTNYNSAAEAEAGIYGMRAVAAYLGDELRKLRIAR